MNPILLAVLLLVVLVAVVCVGVWLVRQAPGPPIVKTLLTILIIIGAFIALYNIATRVGLL